MVVNMEVKLITFIVFIFVTLATDFLMITRKRKIIFSRFPVVMIVFLILLFSMIGDNGFSISRIEFISILLVISSSALFAYYNFVAFIKRSITFSIIINHAKDPIERKDDMEFIDIKMRLDEMLYSGWISEENGGFTLTKQGRIILKLYKFIVTMLRIDMVG